MRLVVAAALLAGVPAGSSLAVPTPDSAKHCALIDRNGRDYRVKARKMKCRYANRWVKRYFNKGTVADGFNCIKTDGGKAPFYCTKSGTRKAYWAEKL